MAYLFDTNHCIYLMNGWNSPEHKLSPQEQYAVTTYNSRREEVLYMSEASVGELLYGVERSQRKAYNRSRLNILFSAIPPVPVTRQVWEIYGQTKGELSKTGKVIPDIDLLIASTSKYYQLILVAHDKHMTYLPASFVRENWASGNENINDQTI
jgi:tRNA(fMet)-specific endonuclease VapC